MFRFMECYHPDSSTIKELATSDHAFDHLQLTVPTDFFTVFYHHFVGKSWKSLMIVLDDLT